ncbi:MAG TPA: hypothetical protein VEY92_01400, partial [Pseudoxanthomonas sp.]|nr:hypothetical protein [Pseudoxanthomonas sp.]
QYGYDGKTPLLDANGRPKTAAAPRWLSGATVGFAGPRNKNLSFFGRPVNTTVARRIAGSAQECSGRVVKTPVIAMIGPIAGRSNEVNVCGGRAVTATPGMGKGRVGGPPARVKVKGKVNPRASSKHSAQAFAKSGAAGEPFTIDHDLSGATTAGQTTVAGEDQLIDSDLMAQCVRKGVARGKATLRFNNPEPIDDNEREEPYEVDTFLLCDDPKTPDQPNDEGNRPRRLFGDPHIVLPNGQGYDFHATGDFTILQTADKSAVVHARFEPASSSAATATSRLAMKVGSDTVEIFKTGTGPEAPMAVKLNGEFLVSKALGVTPFSSTRGYGAEQITYALPGGGTLYADATWTGIAAPDKSYPLELTVIWPAPQGAAGSSPAARVANAVEVSVQANGWLDFMPVFTEEWSGRVAGLLGNGDSNSAGYAGLLMPNGSPLLASANEPLTFGRVYGVFGPAWAVDSRECLFSDGCVEAQMPTSPVILTAAQRATGEAACAAVAEGFFRQACIMDVGITGDVSLANSPVYAQQPAPPGSVPPPPAIALTLNVDTVQGQPNASKDQALTVRSVVPAGYALFLVQPMTAGASVTVNGQALLQPGDGLEGSLAPGVEASNMLRLTCGVQPGEGELGVAPIDPMTQTVQIENTLRVPLLCGQLAAGDAATTAVYGGSAFKIDAQGKLWAWGNNGEGQLGDGTTVHRGTPVRIQLGGDDVNAKSIVVHNGHTSNSYIAYAIDVNGGVWGWGNNPARFTDQYGNMKNMPVLWPTKINLPADVVVKNLISKTTSHNGSSYSPNPANTYAIDTMDRIWAWGSNYAGQLGNGTATPIQNQDPVQVQLPMDVKPISLVFGGGTSQTTAYVVDAGGDVWAWGYNGAGQYGYGMLGNESTVNNSPVPVKVSLPAGVNVQKVATDSDYHTAVIDTEGGLWSWGKHDGALGYHAAANAPSKKPIKVLFPETGVLIDNIQYARGAAFATDRNGAVWAWGNGCDDHCGINPASLVDGHKQITPAKLMFPAGVKIVEIQNQPNSVSYARDEAGRVWGWGGIDEGDNPTLVIASQPVQIALPPSVQISHMKQTHHTNLMIDAEGRVWGVYASWFSNGFRSVTAAPAFSALPLPAGVIAAKAISAGYPDSATIVDTQNRIWRWPINNFSIVAAQVVTP